MGLFDFISRKKSDSDTSQPPAKAIPSSGFEPISSVPRTDIGTPDASWVDHAEAMWADSSQGVWNDLQEALRKQEYDRASSLCEAHEDLIKEHFASWCIVPDDIRHDSPKFDLYMRSLVAVADAFKNAGHPSLAAQLHGSDNSNPVMAWDADLREAQRLLKEGACEEAVNILQARLKLHQKHKGSAKDVLEPRTYGLLGIAFHLGGEPELAIQSTTRALEISKQHQDVSAVETYQENLNQILAAQRSQQGAGPADE